MKNFDHYVTGFDARLKGDGILACPYLAGTDEWADWMEGWKDQNHHLNSREPELKALGFR